MNDESGCRVGQVEWLLIRRSHQKRVCRCNACHRRLCFTWRLQRPVQFPCQCASEYRAIGPRNAIITFGEGARDWQPRLVARTGVRPCSALLLSEGARLALPVAVSRQFMLSRLLWLQCKENRQKAASLRLVVYPGYTGTHEAASSTCLSADKSTIERSHGWLVIKMERCSRINFGPFPKRISYRNFCYLFNTFILWWGDTQIASRCVCVIKLQTKLSMWLFALAT